MPRFMKYLVSILLLFLAPIAVAQESCCPVTVGMLPVPMPPGQTAYDYSGMISGAFLSPLTASNHYDCPRPVDIMSYRGSKDLDRMVDAIGKACGAQPDPEAKQIRAKMHGFDVDYLFIGTLTAANTVIIDGYLYGQFTLYVQLIDNCPGRSGTVLKEGQTSWDGSNTQIAGEGGIICRAALPAIEALGRSFMPLDDIIYDYERVPESCDIQPEKEKVKIGEEITINLQNIVDGRGRPSQPWQQLLVKVEKGEILNGIENGDYRRFPVGGAGTVAVKYKAPDECPDEEKDTIIVENSCNSCAATVVNFPPNREIARKEIKINCGAELEIIRYQVCTMPGILHNELWTSGRISFFIEGNTIEKGEPVELQITGSGYAGECIRSDSGWVEATITSGELLTNENGEPELTITIEEMAYKSSLTTAFNCPDGSYAVNNPVIDVPGTYTLVMLYKDGYTDEITWAQGYCTGTNIYTLYLE